MGLGVDPDRAGSERRDEPLDEVDPCRARRRDRCEEPRRAVEEIRGSAGGAAGRATREPTSVTVALAPAEASTSRVVATSAPTGTATTTSSTPATASASEPAEASRALAPTASRRVSASASQPVTRATPARLAARATEAPRRPVPTIASDPTAASAARFGASAGRPSPLISCFITSSTAAKTPCTARSERGPVLASASSRRSSASRAASMSGAPVRCLCWLTRLTSSSRRFRVSSTVRSRAPISSRRRSRSSIPGSFARFPLASVLRLRLNPPLTRKPRRFLECQ